MQEIDPITGGPGKSGLISATGKLSVALGLIWLCVLCLTQAARFYVHLVRSQSCMLGLLIPCPPSPPPAPMSSNAIGGAQALACSSSNFFTQPAYFPPRPLRGHS